MFERKGIVFDTLNLEQHPELADQIRSLGYTAAPVIIADDMSWSGFRLNKIEELEKRIFREKRNA
jgi:glutaredoxin-like protein NrdH